MDLGAIRKQIKARPIRPIYFLYGEEPYYIDTLGKFIVEQTVNPEMQDFNFSVFYGKDADSATVLDALMRYPMMAAYQVIFLKEAHQMKSFSNLLPYILEPVETTIFIIEYKNTVDKRFKIFKALANLDSAYESKSVRDYQIEQWITDYVSGQKWNITADTTRLLAEYLGTDLQKIVNELDKIMLNKPDDRSVTSEDVERYVGISREFNVFELQKAIGSGDRARSLHIISMLMENEKENSPVMVISMLYAYFSKIYKMHFLRSASPQEQQKGLGLSHSFFLGEFQQATKVYSPRKCESVLSILHEYDLKSKGFEYPAGSGGDMVKEMLSRILG